MIDVILDVFGVLFFILAVCLEVKYAGRRRKKKRELELLDKVIADIRHYFYQSGAALWSLKEAQSRIEGSLAVSLSAIADAIESGSAEEMTELIESSPVGKPLKLLYLMTNSAEEYGDITGKEGTEGYLAGLLDLRMDIRTELRLLTKRGHLYMGFTMTSVVPVITMPAIKAWACQTLPELISFYDGKLGIITRIFILLVTCFIYRSIIRLREADYKTAPGYRFEKLILNRTIAGKLIEKTITKHYTKALKHTDILGRLGEGMNVKVLYLRRWIACATAIAAAAVIYADKNMHVSMGIIDYLVIVFVPAACFFAPIAGLYIRKAMSGNRLEDELADIQLAASMMASTEGMNVPAMLGVMEQFAVQLRPAIGRCLNNYYMEGDDALTALAQSEENEQFARLVECLIVSDDVGMEGAFAEISEDRKKFREYRDQENEYLLEDKANLAMLMAIIPGMLILFVYLLLPFMTEALTLFDNYAGNLEESI